MIKIKCFLFNFGDNEEWDEKRQDFKYQLGGYMKNKKEITINLKTIAYIRKYAKPQRSLESWIFETINHETYHHALKVSKIQDAIWNCVRLGYIPQHHAIKLTKDFQEYKVLD